MTMKEIAELAQRIAEDMVDEHRRAIAKYYHDLIMRDYKPKKNNEK